MNETDLRQLLTVAAEAAEQSTPAGDPVAALAERRGRRQQRRGHLAVLAFIVFVVVVQVSPSEALGADRPSGPASVVAATSLEAGR